MGLDGIRSHLLSVNAGVIDGNLSVEWTYSENVYDQATVEHLAQLYLDALRAIITDEPTPMQARYAPSDFPDAGLSQDELDDLIASMNAQ